MALALPSASGICRVATTCHMRLRPRPQERPKKPQRPFCITMANFNAIMLHGPAIQRERDERDERRRGEFKSGQACPKTGPWCEVRGPKNAFARSLQSKGRQRRSHARVEDRAISSGMHSAARWFEGDSPPCSEIRFDWICDLNHDRARTCRTTRAGRRELSRRRTFTPEHRRASHALWQSNGERERFLLRGAYVRCGWDDHSGLAHVAFQKQNLEKNH